MYSDKLGKALRVFSTDTVLKTRKIEMHHSPYHLLFEFEFDYELVGRIIRRQVSSGV